MMLSNEPPPAAPTSYCAWVSPDRLATFSALRQPLPGTSPEEVLAGLRQISNVQVTVEFNGSTTVAGRSFHRLRVREVTNRQHEMIADPTVPGGRRCEGPSRVVEIFDALHWRTRTERLSVAYRIDVRASPELQRAMCQMQESLRLP
jgi:hypothetical protein